jgi:hypothetical protein
MKNGRSRRFYQSKRFWLVAATVVIVAIVAQGPFFSFVARQIVERGMSRQGLVFRADSVRAAAFAPMVLEGVAIRPAKKGRGGLLVHIDRMEVVWSGPGRLFSGWRNWVHSVTADGMNVVVDLRRPDTSAPRDRAGFDDGASVVGLFAPGGAWPSFIEIRNGSAEVLGENFRHVFDGLDLSLNSEAHGLLRLETLTVQAGKFNKVFGPFTAPTTWEQGNASLAGLDLVPGITLSDVAVRLGSLSGPSLSFSARVFGGALRGEGDGRSRRGRRRTR